MGYNDHGHSFVCKLLHEIQYLTYHLRIESTRRFIEEDHIRLHRQSADDGHTLLLSAGKRGRINVCFILKTDAA